MCRIVVLLVVAGLAAKSHADQPEAVRVTEQELWRALDLNRPELSELKAAVTAKDRAAAASAWAKYFSTRTKPTCHFDRDKWPAYVRQQFPAVADAILREAKRVAAGDLSHAAVRLPIEGNIVGGEINWLHNPKKDTSYVGLVGSQWFMNPIEADGAGFAVALFEGKGTIREERDGVYSLSQGKEQFVVLIGNQESVAGDCRITAEGRLAVVRFIERRPVQAWVVEGSKLVVNERNLLTADRPVTREIAVEF